MLQFMNDDNNPFRSPAHFQPDCALPERSHYNSWLTLALVFISTILGWIWFGVVILVLMEGFHVRNISGIFVLAAISALTIFSLWKSLRHDSKRRTRKSRVVKDVSK